MSTRVAFLFVQLIILAVFSEAIPTRWDDDVQMEFLDDKDDKDDSHKEDNDDNGENENSAVC